MADPGTELADILVEVLQGLHDQDQMIVDWAKEAFLKIADVVDDLNERLAALEHKNKENE